ncbi:RNA polymerase III transcription initiation factor complex subunit [Haplosporangium sp. Z 767]|nr:RNA polymerase III transcription initiation factor complex subunit [Haplosporangium sp. Z 11]KAF9187363.1 RNA polymerase III transcription initiation factor complex subunit [Haplosporangium sp. Z 767]
MDDLVLHVQTEVALDGQSGCNWDRFWYIVDKFTEKSKTTSLADSPETFRRTDEKFRQFFWNNFVQEDGVLFYKNIAATQQGPGQGNTEADSRASYVPFTDLESLGQEGLSYQNVMEELRNSIRIVASAEQQRVALLGYSGVGLQISNQAYEVLQSITATREFGATQAQLAKQHKIDPRSMFHFLKVLIEMKLIIKIPVTTGGQYTLLCLHKKFAPMNPGYVAMNSEEIFSRPGRPLITGDGGRRFEGLLKSDHKKVSYYSGLIKQKLTDILGRAKNQIMTVDDIARALDLTDMNAVQTRWFQRQIHHLIKLKYVQRVSTPDHNRCVQLLRPYDTNLATDEGEKEQLNLKTVIADDAHQSGIYIDTSLEHQVYKQIVESKNQGVIAKEIRRNMNMLNSRLLARILDTLCKPVPESEKALVHRVVEFVGRERRYRYYSDLGFNASVAEDHKEYIEQAKLSLASAPTAATSSQSTPKAASSQAPTSVDTQAARSTDILDTTMDLATATTETTNQALNSCGSTQPSVPSHPEELLAQGADTEDLGASSQDMGATNMSVSTSTTTLAGGSSNALVNPAKGHVVTPERFISVALLKRRKILLSIMERKKMVEVHASLAHEYQKEKHLLFPDQEETSVIDRRTIFRTLNILEAEGLVKIFQVQNIPTIGGGATSKTFVLHPSVDPESEEVNQFVKECSNKQLLFGSLSQKQPSRPEEVALEVESLDEMQQRLGEDFHKPLSIPLSEMGAVRNKTREERAAENPKYLARGCNFDGLEYAVEYGWYKAKMMRALVFHRFILDNLGSSESKIFHEVNGRHILSTAPLFDAMPLRVFLIVVGIVQDPGEENRAYLDQHKNSNAPLNTLPLHIRQLTTVNANFKKRLREVLEVLDALGLATPLEEATGPKQQSMALVPAKNHLVLNTHYEVYTHVKAPLHHLTPELVDEKLEDRKEYMLTSVKECRDFWMDLQSSASNMKNVETSGAKTTVRPWNEIRRDFLLNLCNKRLWADPIRVTAAQRNILMEHVNSRTRYCPSASDKRLGMIAEKSGLPREHVIQFYKAVQAAWYTKPAMAKESRKRRDVARLSKVTRGRPILSRDQTPQQQPSQTLQEQQQQQPQQQQQHDGGVNRSLLQAKQEPRIAPKSHNAVAAKADGLVIGIPKKTRAKRRPWTNEEDDRMLLALAITRYISETLNVRFSWHVVARALKMQRSPEICRHRFAKLIRETMLAKRVENYRAQFSQVFPQIAERFVIDTNLQNFDPCEIMEYFQPSFTQLTSRGIEKAPLFKLPSDPEKIEQLFRIHLIDEPFASVYAEERAPRDISVTRRLALLTLLPPTLRTAIDHELDDSPEHLEAPRFVTCKTIDDLEGQPAERVDTITVRDEVSAQEHLALMTIKVIFSMRSVRLTKELTRVVLENFSPRVLENACCLGKEWKLLKHIKSRSFRIPGQRVGRSEHFLSLMTGACSRLLTLAAQKVDGYYRGALGRLVPPELGPAEMMVLLNNVAMDWVLLSMHPGSGVNPSSAFEEVHGQGVLHHFDVQLRDTKAPNLATTILAITDTTDESKGQKRSGSDDRDEDEGMVQSKRGKSESNQTSNAPSGSWQEAREAVDKDFKAYLGTIPSQDRRQLYRRVYDIVSSSEASGMVLCDIKDAILKSGLAPTDKEIRECIHTLVNRMPPVLMKVGMAHVRYVVFGWHQNWTLNYKAAKAKVLFAEVMSDGGEIPFDAMDWVVPRMWITFEGVFDKVTFEKCLHSVLSYIADKPGISKGSMLNHYSKALLAVEIEDVIEELERRNALDIKYGILPKPASLFSKRGVFVHCDKDTIHERKVTNYFPQPAYYSFLNMELALEQRARDKDTAAIEDDNAEEGDDGEEEGEEGEEEAGASDAGIDRPMSKRLRIE